MEVFLANEQDLPVDEVRLSTLARHVLQTEEVDDSVELSILFVSSDHMRRLNSRFAGDDYATDVLAFPMMDDEDDETSLLLGDVVVCPQVGSENAKKAGHALADELDVLVVHGTLHLLGYDHQEEEDSAEMEARSSEALSSFDPRPAR